MIPLRDEIQVENSAGVVLERHPAYVGTAAAGITTDFQHSAYRMALTVTIEGPTAYIPSEHWIRHRGKRYQPTSEAVTHYQHGEPHHVTITLQIIS